MKKLIKILLLNIVLAATMIFAFGTVAFATSVTNNDASFVVSYSPYTTNSYRNASNYFEGNKTVVEEDNTKIKLWVSNNIVYFSLISTFKCSESGKVDTFSGKVFALHGNGYYDNKLIIGDFDQVGTVNIAQFKILCEKQPILTLLVECTNTGELVEYFFQITQDVFGSLMEMAQANTASLESEIDNRGDSTSQILSSQRIIALMQPSNNFIYKTSTNAMRSQSHSSFKSTSSYPGIYASSTEIKNFCTAINNSLSSGITPSATMQSVLSQTGWKMYKSSSYFYVMHGVANSSTEQLVGITLVSISNNKPDSENINASYTVVGSCTVSYNKTIKIATLLQYDTGIRLENATIAIELVGGTTNFHKATKTWNLDSSGTGVKDILIAISSKLGVASAIWDALKSSNDSSETVDFGTDSNQNLVYDGLVRAIANQTASGKYLWGSGNSLGISGVHYNNSSKIYASHRIAWGFTAYSLL
ncbi:hypothetical protein NDGK_00684 [Clostridiales bacterium CHKCI001]|nr:hypothetical protein NDGK_00684 [Clostridiales bacterium CHKCI001]